ncbi:MAG: hypothetical protein U1F43_35625 [Myxococcota bacterium]
MNTAPPRLTTSRRLGSGRPRLPHPILGHRPWRSGSRRQCATPS